MVTIPAFEIHRWNGTGWDFVSYFAKVATADEIIQRIDADIQQQAAGIVGATRDCCSAAASGQSGCSACCLVGRDSAESSAGGCSGGSRSGFEVTRNNLG